MNKQNVKLILTIAIVLILFAGSGYYIYKDITTPQGSTLGVDNLSNTGYSTQNVGIEVDDGDDVEVEIIQDNATDIPTPNLDRSLPDGVSVKTQERIERVIARLKQNNDLFSDWNDLGLLRKVIGDYEGARQAWEYAAAIRPHSSLPLTNLGFLYGYHLQDYQKAEENYLKAIEKSPVDNSLYYRAYEFYMDAMQDKEKARQILEQGIAANPGTPHDLQVILDSLE